MFPQDPDSAAGHATGSIFDRLAGPSDGLGARMPWLVREPEEPWWPPARPTFLAGAWLDGDLPQLAARELAAAGQWQLRHGAAVSAYLDLALGRELALFTVRGGVKELGHPRPEDFALERLGCSWSHLQELIQIAKHLADLPVLRAMYRAGLLSRSKVRELIRVATPETDAGWARFARFARFACGPNVRL